MLVRALNVHSEAPSESCSESTRPGAFEEAYSQRQRSGASYHDRTMSIGGRAGSAPATNPRLEVESRGRLRRGRTQGRRRPRQEQEAQDDREAGSGASIHH